MPFEVELHIDKLKSNKSPGTDQILAEKIKAGDRTIRYEIINLFLFGIRWNYLRSGRSPSLCLSIRMAIKKIVVVTGTLSLLPTTYKILSSILLSRLTPYAEEIIGNHQGGF